MSELEDRINSLLSDPDQMGKIAQMAKSLMDGSGGNDGGGGGGETLAQAIGSALGGESKAAASSGSGLDGLDAGMLASLGKLMGGGAAGGGSDKRQLLEAMMPYFSDKRREKMKKALRVAQMAKIAGVVFSEYGGEKKDGV